MRAASGILCCDVISSWLLVLFGVWVSLADSCCNSYICNIFRWLFSYQVQIVPGDRWCICRTSAVGVIMFLVVIMVLVIFLVLHCFCCCAFYFATRSGRRWTWRSVFSSCLLACLRRSWSILVLSRHTLCYVTTVLLSLSWGLLLFSVYAVCFPPP